MGLWSRYLDLEEVIFIARQGKALQIVGLYSVFKAFWLRKTESIIAIKVDHALLIDKIINTHSY